MCLAAMSVGMADKMIGVGPMWSPRASRGSVALLVAPIQPGDPRGDRCHGRALRAAGDAAGHAGARTAALWVVALNGIFSRRVWAFLLRRRCAVNLNMVGRLTRCLLLAYRTPSESVRAASRRDEPTRGPWAFWNVVVCDVEKCGPQGSAMHWLKHGTSRTGRQKAATLNEEPARAVFLVAAMRTMPLLSQKYGDTVHRHDRGGRHAGDRGEDRLLRAAR